MSNSEYPSARFRDKAVLVGVKGVVIGILCLAIWSLATQDHLPHQIRATANICICIFLYCNLARVRSAIQELFVPPFKVNPGVEFLIIGGILHPVSFFVS